MSNKGLIGLAVVAVVLGGAAYFLNSGSKGSSPRLNGKAVVPGFDASQVAQIEIGTQLALAAGDAFAQGVFVEYGITFDDDADGERRGGFGSTGVR